MLAAALALVTAYAGTFSVSDRTEVRARTTTQTALAPATTTAATTPAGATDGTTGATGTNAASTLQQSTLSLDLVNQPIAALHIGDREWDYNLGYSPSFALPDVQAGLTPQVLNAANAGVAWHARMVRLSLNEDATYSYQNTGLLLLPGANGGSATPSPGSQGTTSTSLQPLAPPTTVTLASSRTTLAAGLRLTRRAGLLLDVGYSVSGGVGASSRNILPEQYGPRADATFDYAATRSDQLATTASASRTDFTNGICVVAAGTPLAAIDPLAVCAPQAVIVQASQTWRHAFSRSATSSLTIGASDVRARTKPTERYGTTFFPTAGATFTQRFGDRGRSQVDVDVEMAPAIDVRTGLVSQRVQGQASALWNLSSKVGLRLIGGAAHSISAQDPLAFTLVRGELEVDYHATRYVDLSVGERSAWQHQDLFGTFFSTMAYFAVTVRAPALRF